MGVDAPIGNAVAAAKKVPSQGGVGVENAKIYEKPRPSYVPSTYKPELASNSLEYSTVAPISAVRGGGVSSTPYPSEPQEVYITPNSYYPSSTVAPQYYESTTPTNIPEYVRPQTFRPYYNPADSSYSDSRRVYDSVGAGQYSTQQEQFPLYEGVSMTHNGFRYYLPRHYHEEETLPGEQRAGSFGYVDPFGIRRVIYYNANPGSGFVHRKNNRYVGLNSTPYDPRF